MFKDVTQPPTSLLEREKPTDPMKAPEAASESEASLAVNKEISSAEVIERSADSGMPELRISHVEEKTLDARIVTVSDMTETHAAAIVKVAEANAQAAQYQYAVPAQEETKRSLHEIFRRYGLYAVACFGLVLASSHLSGTALAWAFGVIFAALTTREVLPDVLKKKLPDKPTPPTLPLGLPLLIA